MNKYFRISSPRSQLSLFLVLMGGAFFLLILMVGLVQFFSGGSQAAPAQVNIGSLKIQQVLSSIIIFFVPAVLYARFTYRERNLHFLGFRKAERGNFYLLAVLILLFSFPMEGWLGQLNQHIPLTDWMVQMEKEADKQLSTILKANSGWDIFINLLVIAAIPAICEEVCFRGVLQPILIRWFRSPWAGIMVAAIFFSAFHLQFQGFLPRAFLGAVLGAIYWYSDSLWAAILAHFFYNGIQVIALYAYPKVATENPVVPSFAALISIIIVVGLLSAMRRQSSVTYAGVYGYEGQEDGAGEI